MQHVAIQVRDQITSLLKKEHPIYPGKKVQKTISHGNKIPTQNYEATRSNQHTFASAKQSHSTYKPMHAITTFTAQKQPIGIPSVPQSYSLSVIPSIGKRLHSAMITSAKPRKVRALPIDLMGNLLLPVVLGRASSRISIYNIGKLNQSGPHFHNQKFIYPIEFTSKRKFHSCIEPDKKIIYTCKIESFSNNGENVTFVIIPKNDYCNKTESFNSMDDLWSSFKAKFMPLENFPDFDKFSKGEDFFGLDHEGVKKYIQELPGAKCCVDYQFVNYVTRAPSFRKTTQSIATKTIPQNNLFNIGTSEVTTEEDDDDERSENSLSSKFL